MRRTGIAAQPKPLVDKACAASHLALIVSDLLDAGCEVRGCAQTCAANSQVRARRMMIGGRNFGPVIAVRVVDGLNEAMTYCAIWFEPYRRHHYRGCPRKPVSERGRQRYCDA